MTEETGKLQLDLEKTTRALEEAELTNEDLEERVNAVEEDFWKRKARKDAKSEAEFVASRLCMDITRRGYFAENPHKKVSDKASPRTRAGTTSNAPSPAGSKSSPLMGVSAGKKMKTSSKEASPAATAPKAAATNPSARVSKVRTTKTAPSS